MNVINPIIIQNVFKKWAYKARVFEKSVLKPVRRRPPGSISDINYSERFETKTHRNN